MLDLSFTFGISPYFSTFVITYSVFSSGRISSYPYVEIERLTLWCLLVSSSRQWFENVGVSKEDIYRKATPEEVEDALIKEAEKRGFKEEVYVKYPWFKDSEVDKIYKPFYIKGNTYLDGDSFYYNNVKVFKSGVWADIIPTITKSEAEKRLNCKIVD